jgi:MFS family permease
VAPEFTLPQVRRARWAVAAIFFVNGTALGSWAPHIPLVQERLALGPARLGLALLMVAVGAIIAMPLAGAVIGRRGSALPTRVATLAMCLALPLPVLAPDPGLFMAALFILGAANGTMDVAMNAHGVAVERRYTAPVMSSYHGMFSLGGLIGAGMGALLLAWLPPAAHILLAAAVLLGAAVLALPHLLPGEVDRGQSGATFALPTRATIGLGLLCFLVMVCEGAVLDWSAAYLRDDLGASTSVAAIGFAAFSATMAAARFGGDRLRRNLGSVTLVRGSALLAGVGFALGLLLGAPLAGVLGFALAGLGLANTVPVLFGAAGRLPGEASGTGIAAVATTGYLGFLAGPPLIGFAAEVTSLRLALGLLVLACGIVALFARSAASADVHDAAAATVDGRKAA